MNKIYATYFGSIPPTRTTLQTSPVRQGKPNMISLVAVD
jgi:hypothetical protein